MRNTETPKTGAIDFVSVGPGDPELITVKGLRTLQAADLIFCPATQSKQGPLLSRAADIVNALGIPKEKVHLFPLAMSRERTAARTAYDRLCDEVIRQHRTGKQLVIVAEGDAGFYSSIQYVYDKLAADGAIVRRIAGVPAFIAAGARAGLHIVKQEEQLLVAPGNLSAEELSQRIDEGFVVVIMKLSAATEAVHACLRRHPEATFHYFENVGTEQEYYTTDPELLAEKDYPYFSLMIITH